MNGSTYSMMREGCRLTAARDSRGWVIGWGHNGPDVREGLTWTQTQANMQFFEDYADAVLHALRLVGSTWPVVDVVRRAALADMAFELGMAGLGGFNVMLDAVRDGNWAAADAAVMASAYAHQVPARASAAAIMLLTGNWPEGFDK
jgi:lysozyme